jgi:cold shock CspA family protein
MVSFIGICSFYSYFKWSRIKFSSKFKSDYNNEDVFVHASAIIKNNPNKYKASLSEGEPVEFDILKRKLTR